MASQEATLASSLSAPAAAAAPPQKNSADASSQSLAHTVPSIRVQFKAVGATPLLRGAKMKVKVLATETVASLARYLKQKLEMTEDQPLWVYVNASFEPAPEEYIGTLCDCYGISIGPRSTPTPTPAPSTAGPGPASEQGSGLAGTLQGSISGQPSHEHHNLGLDEKELILSYSVVPAYG